MLYYFKKVLIFLYCPLVIKKNFSQFFYNQENIKKYNLNILKSTKSNFTKKKINIFLFDAGINTNKLQRIIKSLKFIPSNNELFWSVMVIYLQI